MEKVEDLLSRFGVDKTYLNKTRTLSKDIYEFNANIIPILDEYLVNNKVVMSKSQYQNIQLYIKFLNGCLSPKDARFKEMVEFDKYLASYSSDEPLVFIYNPANCTQSVNYWDSSTTDGSILYVENSDPTLDSIIVTQDNDEVYTIAIPASGDLIYDLPTDSNVIQLELEDGTVDDTTNSLGGGLGNTGRTYVFDGSLGSFGLPDWDDDTENTEDNILDGTDNDINNETQNSGDDAFDTTGEEEVITAPDDGSGTNNIDNTNSDNTVDSVGAFDSTVDDDVVTYELIKEWETSIHYICTAGSWCNGTYQNSATLSPDFGGIIYGFVDYDNESPPSEATTTWWDVGDTVPNSIKIQGDILVIEPDSSRNYITITFYLNTTEYENDGGTTCPANIKILFKEIKQIEE